MRILSCFDGISCAYTALQRAGIPIESYHASEINKNAIAISKAMYPDIVHLGDITKLDVAPFIDKVDLVVSGSPCTNLSVGGTRTGLNGKESALFYPFMEY